jgi:5-methylcytosine-specific restriction endonuclease McrA
MTRTCKKCGETKPLDMFMKSRNCRHGRSHQCKACSVAGVKAWREAGNVTVDRNLKARRREAALWHAAVTNSWDSKRRGARFVEHVVPLIVLEREDGLCWVCGEDVDPLDTFDCTLDHVEPCRDGGDHSYENVRLAHRGCNTSRALHERHAA